MPQPCAVEECKRKSRALCYCCSKSLCLAHLKEHQDITNSQLNPFVDELNVLADQLLKMNVNNIIENSRQKLDQWRDDCYKIISRLYEEKCQELQERCCQRMEKQRKDINETRTKVNDLIREHEATNEDIPLLKSTIDDIKHDVNQFAEKGIIVDVNPAIINKNLIYIEEWTSNEIDISCLSLPFRKLNCSNNDWPVMASNNRFLLLDQYPNLFLFDKELNIVKQSAWEYDRIPDMCWSSTLNSFIIITGKDGVFQVNDNILSIEPIPTIEKQKWLSCTCSESALFLTTNQSGSNIFQFNFLSSIQLIKQWNPPESCNSNDTIHNMAYNNGALALIITQGNEKALKIELRSSQTLIPLWSFTLGMTYISGERVNRLCLLKCDEWLIVDNKSSCLIQISKDGKLKVTQNYGSTPHNAVLFDSNILAIRTTKSIDFYRV